MLGYPHFTDQDIADILAYTDGKPATATAVPDATSDVDQEAVAAGKKVFNANCAACHKLDKKLVGPALGGIAEKREVEWLKAWIKDNNALVASGDKLAKDVANSNPAAMTAFPQLSDTDLDNLLLYFEVGNAPKKTVAAGGSGAMYEDEKTGVWAMLGYTLLGFVLFVIIIAGTLKKNVGEEEFKENLLLTFFKNPFLRFLFLIFSILLGVWLLFGWFMQIDVNEGYTPIQPIAFSHAVHAGDNKIDCQYCHSSAKHSKTSGVPTANVCMNCHKSISEYTGPLFDGHTKEELDGEIAKIYDAVGWDADQGKYKEDAVQKPIEWVRVHNLADFVYYNHSQHVTVAGLACQKCHGPVEEMHEMTQFSPLTMGWCIDCHRDTEVDMTENGYYKKIHDQLAEKYGVEKVTEAQMGGLECGKCHY
ncbi:MAG: cytochrome C [Flavobacteriaceae bacterium]|nr:MAG: cytochrome C [Flavobacteriaceae bacterium]